MAHEPGTDGKARQQAELRQYSGENGEGEDQLPVAHQGNEIQQPGALMSHHGVGHAASPCASINLE